MILLFETVTSKRYGELWLMFIKKCEVYVLLNFKVILEKRPPTKAMIRKPILILSMRCLRAGPLFLREGSRL